MSNANMQEAVCQAIDFSKIKRLTPKADSWDKVCKRLDEEESSKFISLKAIYGAIPMAAGFMLVAFTAMFFLLTHEGTSPISMDEITSSEFTAWYDELGEEETNDFEFLDESTTISYLMKEEK